MRKLIAALLFAWVAVEGANAQDLVYKPRNPAFGGDTFNYQWLLSGAQAQDTFKDSNSTASSLLSSRTTTLDDFAEALNRQLLSQISQQLVKAQFGENGLQPGSYSIGNFTVDVGSTLDGILIDIIDQSTGQQTQVSIPYF